MAKEINFDDLDFDDFDGEEKTAPKVQGTLAKKEAKENKIVNLVPQDTKEEKEDYNYDKCDILTIQDVRTYPQQKIDELAASGIIKLQAIERELNEELVEREELIRNAMRALISGSTVFLYGPPGTAKSLVSGSIGERIVGGKYFQWLLSKASDPSEIVGPISLKAMERDSFRRKTTNTIVDAHVGFIDEIFKGNSPTINILLSIINERIFYNDGKPNKIPLITFFCASNEVPEEDEGLSALYDRLIIRIPVEDVKEPANRIKMMEIYTAKRNGTFKTSSFTTISIEELLALQINSEKITISKAIFTAYDKLKAALNKQGITYSSRRTNEGLKLMQANALYEGRDIVGLDDFNALKYVLWNDFKHIQLVEEEILKISNPYDGKINDLVRKFDEIKGSIDQETDDEKRKTMIVEGTTNFKGIIKKFDSIIKDARKNGKDVNHMLAKKQAVVDYATKLMEETLGIAYNPFAGEIPTMEKADGPEFNPF